MKKVKKKKYFWILMSMILAVPLTFLGCQDTLEIDDYNNSSFTGGTPLEQAITWYNAQKNGDPVLLTSLSRSGEGQLFYTEPSWKYTCTSSNEELSVVDVDLTDRIGLDFVSETNLSKFKESGEYRYRRSYSRLVIMTDKASLQKSGYVMTILPSLWYIEHHEADIHLNTYLRREPNLDGYVLFHDLNGQFVNGWRYESGKVTGRIKSLSPGHQEEESNTTFNYETMPASYTVAPVAQSRYGGESSGGSFGGGGSTSSGSTSSGNTGSGNTGSGITGNNTDGYVIPEVVITGTAGHGNTVILPPVIIIPSTGSGNKGTGTIEPGSGPGTVSGGGSGTSDKQPTPDKITIENFLKKIFTTEFIEKIFRDLNVNTGKITITFEPTDNPMNNASYDPLTQTLNINPPMLNRGYTTWDLTSIIYHEMVHVKQDMVDHIKIERNSKGEIVMKKYQVPYDDYYIADKWDSLYSVLDVNNVPHDLKNCTPQQKQIWNYYYELYVKPYEDARNRGETYTIEANIDYLRCEIEAYGRQLKEYGSLMSEANRRSITNILEGLQRRYEYIKNQK